MAQPAARVRVRRTKIRLRAALIELVEAEGLDTLTVGKLTEHAMVSRAAFYRNYQDISDLVEQIFDEALSTLFEAVGELRRDDAAVLWVRFFEHIAQYDRLYRALLGEKGSAWFVRKMRTRLAELIKERGSWSHEPAASPHTAQPTRRAQPVHHFPDTFVPNLVAAMFVEAITWWLEQGQPCPPKELATRTALLASALFREADTWS